MKLIPVSLEHKLIHRLSGNFLTDYLPLHLIVLGSEDRLIELIDKSMALNYDNIFDGYGLLCEIHYIVSTILDELKLDSSQVALKDFINAPSGC